MNSTFRARWLASSEVISQVIFTSEQPKKNKMAFVGILSQIKLLFGPLVIQLVWYILKQLFTSVSVKVVDIYLADIHHYSPPLRWIIVNYRREHLPPGYDEILWPHALEELLMETSSPKLWWNFYSWPTPKRNYIREHLPPGYDEILSLAHALEKL